MTLVAPMGVESGRFACPPAAERAVVRSIPHYRADIDGLRAISVLAVALLHSGLAGFSGGFIGVDIFFVISGYLIHRDLTANLAEGRVSVLGFYGRRLRRTVPALYVVAGVTLVAATCILIPGDLDEAARSLFPTIAFVSNLYSWQDTGYFAAEALTKPLLHCWSLGVEAQFYLVAPLLAWGLHRLDARARRTALVILFLLALATALALHRAGWATGFYLAPARLFEFLIGVALAEGVVPPPARRWTAEIVAGLALLTIGLCVVFFSNRFPHPGLPTLVPCLAAGAIILVGGSRQTVVGRLFARPAFAFIGLISYSIYLWHWPILVLTRAAGLAETLPVMAVQAALVLGLSVLTWRFVEVPFRARGSLWRGRLPWLAPVGAAALAVFALALLRLDGLPQRFPPDVAAVAAYYNHKYDAFFRQGQCFITSKERSADFDHAVCLRLDPRKPNVLLLGDSHAAQLYAALRDTWPGVNLLQATASGCKAVIGAPGLDRCTGLMTQMLEQFIPAHRLDAVVIAGLWDDSDVAPLKRTIETLSANVGRIVVFGPLPRWDMPLATLLARDMMRHSFDDVPRHLFNWVAPLDRRMRDAVAPLVTYVSPWRILCGGDHCRLFTASGVPIQFDYNHLTPAGAAELMAAVRERNPTLFETPYRSTSSR